MEAFLTSTVTVALAEIGDKTQLLSLLLATRFRKPLPIIAGILVATLANHAASAWLGGWASQFFQSDAGQWIVGGSFIAVGLWLLVPDKDEEPSTLFDRFGVFGVTTGLFFLAEIGDKTQIATVLLGVEYQALVLVTAGTTLGMMLANVPVIYAGQALMDRIPMNAVRKLAAATFVAVGIWSLLS
ncbi:TMEM165/GDT1 family protein [Sneathiella chinensis]|uniref:GDT1 family protein n=1 Tax=Sneathiella chinensis TaxID=349750 RepID=A0ABQ5TYS8_9PROT|nr:TMEM165/GDT1 family protein [Sneathiella chinensis]GLQ04999.1 UPF0016 family membrane protein [Sneathiella chinensis]